ncbi:hypothetical protein AGMMS4952_05660 [Spirochaetia bacterium]|nr:hypothetical protein AGMMS4952_05660 [Spirochaetia bacterium]
MIDSVEFAKYVISRVKNYNSIHEEDTISLGETKLQKLIYICDGYMNASNVNFISENVRAWNYGPVYPRVHKWAGTYGDLLAQNELCTDDSLKQIAEVKAEPLVDRVIEMYGHETAQTLSLWSHRPGSPWEKALERGHGKMNSLIEKADMGDYFRGLLSESV